MIEVIYRKESVENSKGKFKLPKNIKQIGGGETDIQVYMEDNVACYLQKVPDEMENIRYGVLLGQVRQSCGYNYIFIDGAVDVREIINNTVIFSNDVWSGLNDDISYYFRDKQVVGWFLSEPYNNSSQSTWIKKTHINHFAGNDKIFFLLDREEDDENFYYYKSNKMDKLPCYHIYYEKNEDMKTYVQLSGMNLRFKKKGGYDDLSKLESKTVQEPGKIKLEEKSEQESKRVENKYNNGKYGMLLSRAASILLVGVLAYTTITMGNNGTFDGMAENVKKYIGNIIDNTKEKGDEAGIIPVSGTEIKAVSGTAKNENKPKQEESENDTKSDKKNNEESSESNKDDKTEKEPEPTEATESTDKGQKEDETKGQDETISTITPAATSLYTVKEGDTLYKICQRLYGNTDNMNAIMEMNQLEDADAIIEGENLIVP